MVLTVQTVRTAKASMKATVAIIGREWQSGKSCKKKRGGAWTFITVTLLLALRFVNFTWAVTLKKRHAFALAISDAWNVGG
jgi:EamA domain-containing membrane protein RarD